MDYHWSARLLRLTRQKTSVVAVGLLGFLLVTALLGCQIVYCSPFTPDFSNVAQPPSSQHWLGTDELGRDMLSRIIYGLRTALLIAITVQCLATFVGTIVGLVSGYYGRLADALLMRLVDFMYSIPSFLFIVLMVSILNPTIWSIVLTLSLISWPLTARLVRGQVLLLREREFVLAARALGGGDAHILSRHIFPHLLGVVIVQFTFGMSFTVMSESTLSFLGIGIPSPHPSLGTMISKGRNSFLSFPHLIITPSIVLILLMLAFNLLGDSLRDTFD